MNKISRAIFILLPLLFLCGCSTRQFRIGGVQIRSTLPSFVIYTDYADGRWDFCARYYEAESPDAAVESVKHGYGATLEEAIEDIENLTGRDMLYMNGAALILGPGITDEKAVELEVLRRHKLYIFKAAENVAEIDNDYAGELFIDVMKSAKSRKLITLISIDVYLDDLSVSVPEAEISQNAIAIKINPAKNPTGSNHDIGE